MYGTSFCAASKEKVRGIMYNIIVNPWSGEGKKRKLHRRAIEHFQKLGQEIRVFASERPGQIRELARSITEKGEGDVVVIGGDGTLHDVLNGFADFDRCALGLILAGTGNDFAAAANIPLEPETAVEQIVNGAPRYTEFMQLPRGVRGLNVAGTGIDVEILRRCRSSKWLRGKMQYLISLIISLIKFKNYELSVRVNGHEVLYKTLIACVGNGFRIGGGIRMCPQAVLGDNLLDFVAVDNVKKSRILPAFIKLMQGRILEEKFSRFERCDHIEIFSNHPFTVQVDGELYDELPFVVDVVKDTLRMYRG